MSDPTNEDRADRAEAVMQFYCKDSDLATHYNKSDEIDRSDAADLISDLFHHLNRQGIDPLGVLHVAKANFYFELKEES